MLPCVIARVGHLAVLISYRPDGSLVDTVTCEVPCSCAAGAILYAILFGLAFIR
jgi:hypothetical protein